MKIKISKAASARVPTPCTAIIDRLSRDRFVFCLAAFGFQCRAFRGDGAGAVQVWTRGPHEIVVRNAAEIGREWALRELRRCDVPEAEIEDYLTGRGRGVTG